MTMIFRLALRNLFRNRWRSALTVGGVAVAVALLVWTLAYMDGFIAEMVRGATAVELGQIKVQTTEYVDRPSAQHAFLLEDKLQQIEAVEGVAAAAPRVRVFGLVGNEETSGVAQIVGIDRDREPNVSIIKNGLIAGAWLAPPAPDTPVSAVLGEGLARHIKATPGDELVMFFEAADGSLGNDVLKVAGILKTGNSSVDRTTVYVDLGALQYAAALDGQAHEIVIKNHDILDANQTAQRLRQQFPQLSVRPWNEMAPELAQIIAVTENSDLIMFGLVYLIVAFGLFNAQRMSALERTREFGVILAVGVQPWQLFATVLLETIFVTLAGALLGSAFGAGISYYHEVVGLDLTMFSDTGSFDMMGISFSSTLYFDLTLRSALRPVLFIVPVAILCGLWPAYKAARLNIVEAISGRT